MTIQKRIESELVDCGLWPKEADAVMKELKAGNTSMEGRWDEDETGYPLELLAALFLAAKIKAVEWIDSNKPSHFARSLLS